jgi:hypothetical protein
MKRFLFLALLFINMTNSACSALATNQPAPTVSSMATTMMTVPSSQGSEPTSSGPFRTIYLVEKYSIDIPENFTFREILSSNSTIEPVYLFETPEGKQFEIVVHSYNVSASLVPGKCNASIDFDNGVIAAPFFCEGLELVDNFIIANDLIVKYRSEGYDLSLQCTANSSCPVDVPPETRYSITYVFVVADKPNGTTLEFYAGDAFRGPDQEITGFKGLGFILHDQIIPSLSITNH